MTVCLKSGQETLFLGVALCEVRLGVWERILQCPSIHFFCSTGVSPVPRLCLLTKVGCLALLQLSGFGVKEGAVSGKAFHPEPQPKNQVS
jgi:hypothetical protein